MKPSTKYLSGIFLGLALTVLPLPSGAQELDKLKATVPFSFSVGDKELAPGNYLIKKAGDSGPLIIRNEDTGAQQVVFGIPLDSGHTGKHERLVFERYGSEHFLSQIWFSGDEDGQELVRGVNEKRAAAKQPVMEPAVAGQ
jgi:hypothetical protein